MFEKREIGLKAVHSARADRKRSKYGRVTGPVWLTAGGAVIVTLITASMLSNRSLNTAREEILSQQRAAVATVGAEWFPLRDRIEGITLAAASSFGGDHVAPEAARWDFRSVPGIYLRLRVAEAKDVDALREHARESVKDAFTGCLLRHENPALVRGEPDAGFGPDQPWNLRQAYAATRVLSEGWVQEVKDSDNKDRLRIFEQQYDKAKRVEIPLAIDIVKKAQLFLLVLDEDVPEAAAYATDGGIDSEALQQVPHPARIHVIDLRNGEEIVRLRRAPDVDVLGGEATVRDPAMRASVRRQINNCALADEVWSAIRPDEAPTTPIAPTDEPSDAGASPGGARDPRDDAK